MYRIYFGEKKVLKNFNLIITTSRGNEDNTCSEILNLLGEVGDVAATVDKTGITGLIVAKTAFSPFEIIEKFRGILKERPWDFRYTLRVIPIEKVVPTDLREIERIAMGLSVPHLFETIWLSKVLVLGSIPLVIQLIPEIIGPLILSIFSKTSAKAWLGTAMMTV